MTLPFASGPRNAAVSVFFGGDTTMATYLVTYHGGGEMPASAEARQQMMAAFGAWAGGVGSALIDPGAPLAAAKTVSAEKVVDGPAQGPAGGYTLLRADSLDAAVQLVAGHPFLARGGSLQVSETVDLGG
jgi:hypothetical protein